ncbi:MAG: helix-turn-helix transcriptional regulator [Kiritimatiellae bacterium]|nr:helix-turn-helix transcriptional regulator [Kiritimatiellia bacterium]
MTLIDDRGLHVGAGSRVVKEVRGHRRHSHPFFEILCISEGHTRVIIRGKQVEAGPGDLLIYYPFEDHEEYVQAGRWSILTLRFSPEKWALPISFPSRETTEPLVHLPWPDRFQNLFHQMLLERRTGDRWGEMMMAGYLTIFVALLHRALAFMQEQGAQRESERSQRIGKAIELIHEGLDRDFSLKDLADESFMSESHFSHTFKAMTGVSPKKYLTRTKMLKAQELLKGTDETVKAIAATLGFEDAHYFSKVFRRHTGKTPSQFRARER